MVKKTNPAPMAAAVAAAVAPVAAAVAPVAAAVAPVAAVPTLSAATLAAVSTFGRDSEQTEQSLAAAGRALQSEGVTAGMLAVDKKGTPIVPAVYNPVRVALYSVLAKAYVEAFDTNPANRSEVQHDLVKAKLNQIKTRIGRLRGAVESAWKAVEDEAAAKAAASPAATDAEKAEGQRVVIERYFDAVLAFADKAKARAEGDDSDKLLVTKCREFIADVGSLKAQRLAEHDAAQARK